MFKEKAPTYFGWVGWRLRMPEEWRPLRIEGDWRRGSAMLGDGARAILLVKWWRPGERDRFQWGRWIQARLKAVGNPKTDAGAAPSSPDFDKVSWAPPKDGLRAFWYGWSAKAGLVIEATLNAAVDPKHNRLVETRILPSLRVDDQAGPIRWAFYSASFVSPPGFRLIRRKLQLGEAVLWLEHKDGSRLLLRQNYPARLALERRPLEKWLIMDCFKESRRYRATADARPWELRTGRARFQGWRESGVKKLPAPLGFIKPFKTITAIVRDTEFERLLMAQYDSLGEPREEIFQGALEGMNWALREEEGGD